MLSLSIFYIFALLLLTLNPIRTAKLTAVSELEEIPLIKNAAESSSDRIPLKTDNLRSTSSHQYHAQPTYPSHEPNLLDKITPPSLTNAQKRYIYGTSYGPGGAATQHVWDFIKKIFYHISRPFRWLITSKKQTKLTQAEAQKLAEAHELDPLLKEMEHAPPEPKIQHPHQA